MKALTKLPITFAPIDGLNSWRPRISADAADSVNGARASARFNAGLSSAVEIATTQKFSQRSGMNATLRIAPRHCRTARRRLFAPSHTFEHRLP